MKTSTNPMPLSRKISLELTPPRVLVLSFALLILIGSALLMLPAMHLQPHMSYIDALFTSTSAVCVTGLITVDTGTAWTISGQLVILMLIQLGGLGIMTFSVFFYELAGKEVSIRHEFAVRNTFSYLPNMDVTALLRSVVLFTLVLEGIGALLLFFFFLPDHSAPSSAYLAIFHSISAFCNAGFSLWPDSLTRYGGNTGVNLTVTLLIVSGGLGFIVLEELKAYILKFRTKGPRRLSLHSRIVLRTTLALIAVGFIGFFVLEWHNAFAGMNLKERILASLFQAITPRTAGFNTVNYAHLTDTSLLLTIFLMFIGGSPGSTAGGIKTCTTALIFALAISRYRGFSKVNIMRRSVSEEIVSRSLTVTLVAILIICSSLLLLLASQSWGIDHSQNRDVFLELLFEATSAFGTVGLSLGITPDLTAFGKLIIILTMFLGRVGPLTVAMALLRRSSITLPYNYGHENVMIG